MTTDPIAAARELVERLDRTLGGVTVPNLMHGDNLAITLCTAYDNPDQDTDDETGWTPDAISGQEAVLSAIRAHYAPLTDALEAERAKVAAAYEAAACVTVGMGPRYDGRSVHYHIPERVKGAIRALTPSDAQAALDKMLAAARAEAAEAALTAAAGGA